jgi:acyl carrier protein
MNNLNSRFASSVAAETAPAASDKVREIAAQIFQVNAESLDLEMGPDAVESWDSLNHLRLITEVESTFGIRLSMQQIQDVRCLADLAHYVASSPA